MFERVLNTDVDVVTAHGPTDQSVSTETVRECT